MSFFYKQSVKLKSANKQDLVLFLNLQYIGFQNITYLKVLDYVLGDEVFPSYNRKYMLWILYYFW